MILEICIKPRSRSGEKARPAGILLCASCLLPHLTPIQGRSVDGKSPGSARFPLGLRVFHGNRIFGLAMLSSQLLQQILSFPPGLPLLVTNPLSFKRFFPLLRTFSLASFNTWGSLIMLQLDLDFCRFIPLGVLFLGFLFVCLFSVPCLIERFPPIISPSLLQGRRQRAQTSCNPDEPPAPEAWSSFPWNVYSWPCSDLLTGLLYAQTLSLASPGWLSRGAVPALTVSSAVSVLRWHFLGCHCVKVDSSWSQACHV